MATEPQSLSQPEIEDDQCYRQVLDQRDRFSDQSSVGYFEVCGQQKGSYEVLGTERLLEILRTGESRKGKGGGVEVKVRVLYVQNSSFPLVLGLPALAKHNDITLSPVNCYA